MAKLYSPLSHEIDPKSFSNLNHFELFQTVVETRRSNPDKFSDNESTILTTVAEMKVKLVAATLAQAVDEDLKADDLDLVRILETRVNSA